MEVVGKYVEGCRVGKSEVMKPAFSEDAVMVGYLNGELSNGSIQNLFAAVDALGADDKARTRVDVLDIKDTAATVRVVLEDWHNIAFTDFHSLVKLDGKWKIVAKIFHQY